MRGRRGSRGFWVALAGLGLILGCWADSAWNRRALEFANSRTILGIGHEQAAVALSLSGNTGAFPFTNAPVGMTGRPLVPDDYVFPPETAWERYFAMGWGQRFEDGTTYNRATWYLGYWLVALLYLASWGGLAWWRRRRRGEM